MAHEFENGMFVGKAAWHRLGTVIDKAPSIEEGIKLAGLDWRAELKDIVTVQNAQSVTDYALSLSNETYDTIEKAHQQEEVIIKPDIKHKAVVRSTDGNVLGVVGPRYTVLQNSSAFNWFSDYIDAGLCKLETAGSLKGGRVVWILASIQRPNREIVKGDDLKNYFLISNSHDGTQAVRIGQTIVRVVCANTLALSYYSRNSSLIRIRHSAGVKQNLESMKQIIDEVDMSFKATAEQYQLLVSKQINSADLYQYVKILLNVDKIEDKDISTRTRNILEKIMGNMDSPNQQISNISGTWYASYQAYNEWLCHNSGRNEENRLHNVWFGTGIVKNNTALDLAVKMAG